jgi:hypothetical protein
VCTTRQEQQHTQTRRGEQRDAVDGSSADSSSAQLGRPCTASPWESRRTQERTEGAGSSNIAHTTALWHADGGNA